MVPLPWTAVLFPQKGGCLSGGGRTEGYGASSRGQLQTPENESSLCCSLFPPPPINSHVDWIDCCPCEKVWDWDIY
jgi:hypothetical protein